MWVSQAQNDQQYTVLVFIPKRVPLNGPKSFTADLTNLIFIGEIWHQHAGTLVDKTYYKISSFHKREPVFPVKI